MNGRGWAGSGHGCMATDWHHGGETDVAELLSCGALKLMQLCLPSKSQHWILMTLYIWCHHGHGLVHDFSFFRQFLIGGKELNRLKRFKSGEAWG